MVVSGKTTDSASGRKPVLHSPSPLDTRHLTKIWPSATKPNRARTEKQKKQTAVNKPTKGKHERSKLDQIRSDRAGPFDAVMGVGGTAKARTRNPTSSIILGDGHRSLMFSAYSRGLMGFHTPNIDRVPRKA